MKTITDTSKIKAYISQVLDSAESLYKKNKYHDCIKILHRLELRVRPYTDRLSDEIFDIHDKRCLVYRKIKDFTKARNDANSMIRINPKAFKGYLCAAKLYEMEGSAQLALKMYNAGLANIDKEDPAYQRFKNAYSSFKQSLDASDRKQIPTDPIKHLPYPDIFHNILKMLPLRTIVACARVSKEWRQFILHDHNLWCQGFDLSVKSYTWSLRTLKIVLKPALGSSQSPMMISSLTINRIPPPSELAFLKYFGTNLSGRLRALNVQFETVALYEFMSNTPGIIFGGLQTLTISSVFCFNMLKDLLENIPSLKELNVISASSSPPNWFNKSIKDSSQPYVIESLSLKNLIDDLRVLKLINDRMQGLKRLEIYYSLSASRNTSLRDSRLCNILQNGMDNLECFSTSNDVSPFGYTFRSNAIKSIKIHRSVYSPSHSVSPHPNTSHYSTETLRLFHCSFSEPNSHDRIFHHLRCGPNLVLLFLEFTNLEGLYSEEGYRTNIANRFPNLRTISLAGNSSVSNRTAKAIAESPTVPNNVILSLTSVTDRGFDELVKAGVHLLGLQHCNINIKSIQGYRSKGISLYEHSRFG